MVKVGEQLDEAFTAIVETGYFLPETMQMIGKLTLVYWSIEGFSGALWEGAGLMALAPTLGVILLYSAGLMAIAIWRFRKSELFN